MALARRECTFLTRFELFKLTLSMSVRCVHRREGAGAPRWGNEKKNKNTDRLSEQKHRRRRLEAGSFLVLSLTQIYLM